MYALTYLSTYCPKTGIDVNIEQLLRDLFKTTIERNLARDISGYLVFENGYFLQTLEGEESAVADIYASISRDVRHRDLTVLHHGEIAQRYYRDFGISVSSRRGSGLEIGNVVAHIKARAMHAPNTLAHRYFRMLLTPGRRRLQTSAADRFADTRPKDPTRVALSSSQAFWLYPTFNHIATLYGEAPQSSNIADVFDAIQEPVALEYVDINVTPANVTRVLGVNDGLLTSQAAQPTLSELDLIVILARAREPDEYFSFVGHLLSYAVNDVQKPLIMLICPDPDAEFILAIKEAAELQGFQLQVHPGAPKNGDEVWAHMRSWLMDCRKA